MQNHFCLKYKFYFYTYLIETINFLPNGMFQSFSNLFKRTAISSSIIVFHFNFFGSIMDENNFPDVKYFLNSKGNRQLIDSENYVYCWNRGPKDDTRDVRSYWRCDQYLICKSYATVLNGKIISVKPHDKHGSDLAGLQAKLQEIDALKLATCSAPLV